MKNDTFPSLFKLRLFKWFHAVDFPVKGSVRILRNSPKDATSCVFSAPPRFCASLHSTPLHSTNRERQELTVVYKWIPLT